MTADPVPTAPPRSFWLRHPALLTLTLTVLILLVALAWPLLRGPATDAPPAQDLPWQIEPLPQGGSRVFGIEIGHDLLQRARDRWGEDLQIAVMAARGEAGALEASVERYTAGFVTGRLIISLDVPPDMLERWRKRVAKRDIVEGGTASETLHADDLPEALRSPIVGLAFIPSAHLDGEIVRLRFGAPAEQYPLNGQQHWLYPERGLAVLIDPERRELLQYVAPRDFDRRLRQPLVAAVAAAASAAK